MAGSVNEYLYLLNKNLKRNAKLCKSLELPFIFLDFASKEPEFPVMFLKQS